MPADRLRLSKRRKNNLHVNTSLVQDIRAGQPESFQSSRHTRGRNSTFHPYPRRAESPIYEHENSQNHILIVIKPVHQYHTRRARTRVIFIVKPRPAPPPPPPFEAFHDILPGISVAFSNDDYNPTAVFPPHYSSSSSLSPEGFTHIMRIVHPSAHISKGNCRYHYSQETADDCSALTPGEVWAEYDDSSRRAILTLVTYPMPHAIPNIPSLTHAQIVAARDFISLALPCFTGPSYETTNCHPEPPELVSDPAHILITGPGKSSSYARLIDPDDVREQTTTDILSILTVYMAFVDQTLQNPKTRVRTTIQHLSKIVCTQYERARRYSLKHAQPGTQKEEDIEAWIPCISEDIKVHRMLEAAVTDCEVVQLPRYQSK